MMRKNIINTTTMNIKIFPQILKRNTRTLNMPARIPKSPRRFPFKFLIIKLRLSKPKNKISLILFINIQSNIITNPNKLIILSMIS